MISVILPSRGRAESLVATVISLQAKSSSPIEVLIGADPDDAATKKAAKALGKKIDTKLFVADKRYGYAGLHFYVNRLAGMAAGEWLLLWNDDARMLTAGWDVKVDESRPGVLFPRSNHPPALNCFPIVHRGVVTALSHVSLSPHYDSWIQDVATAAGCHFPVDIDILHDRVDLTGGHDDETAKETQGQYRTTEYHSPELSALRAADVDALRRIP